MISGETSLRDVAGIIASKLREIGYDPVVVGGSAATIHAAEAYRSDDIDMVIIGGIDDPQKFRRALETLGYASKGGMFVHAHNRYTIEFVPSPVAIGSAIINEFASVETLGGKLRVLLPRDVVADRLNKYVAWNDEESFLVAVDVSKACSVEPDDMEPFITTQAIGIDREAFEAAFARYRRALSA